MLALVKCGVRTTSRRFFQSREGSVAMLFALALIPLMIAAGAALDYSRANSFKAVLQATLDSALLAGAKDGSSNWTPVALNVFQSNLAAKSSASLTPTFSLDGNGSYTGSVSAAVPTFILVMIKIQSLNVTANLPLKRVVLTIRVS